MNPVVLFREVDRFDADELDVCKGVFPTYKYHTDIPAGSLVIPRYSALPFYKDLEYNIKKLGSKMLNTYSQHLYVADMNRWYWDLELYTPKTYFRLQDVPDKGPFVLKGSTNSKKFSWKTHMFAADKAGAVDVWTKLSEDSLISQQDIVIREFVPFREYGTMACGIPISHEFRCFFYKDKLLAKGFYWSNEVSVSDDVPEGFLGAVAAIVSPNVNFWVVDVAKDKEGRWWVVELNDGQMSGLSDVDPEVLYRNLDKAIRNNV